MGKTKDQDGSDPNSDDPEIGDHQIPALPDIDPPLAIRENQERVERFLIEGWAATKKN